MAYVTVGDLPPCPQHFAAPVYVMAVLEDGRFREMRFRVQCWRLLVGGPSGPRWHDWKEFTREGC